MTKFTPEPNKNYKNIIFDLGNVLINVDLMLTFNKFIDFGLKIYDKQDFFGRFVNNGLLFDFEKGLFGCWQFFDKVRNELEFNFSDSEIIEAWNALLLDIPQKRIDLLYELKKSYNLYLLSNTNEIHLNTILQCMIGKYRKDIFSEIFIKEHYSHQLHLRKPDSKIFRYVLMHARLHAEETLFIDDSADNIAAANAHGINGFLLTKETEVADLFI
jgi:putative hydrolase of the HAD superfamily